MDTQVPIDNHEQNSNVGPWGLAILAVVLAAGFGVLWLSQYSSSHPAVKDGERDAIVVGVVKSVEAQAGNNGAILISRVTTTDGKSYSVAGVPQGFEGTTLTAGKGARNDVQYLCGGLPKACLPLM